ncbi:hypothetical protein [Limnothrix redekei]|uniref:Uncharacterized protein n=1 Tax=Limnothrix redekei LRLZ20PSL1 TaxID=3112953 RepID=A0ABW7CB29_9CYAN
MASSRAIAPALSNDQLMTNPGSASIQHRFSTDVGLLWICCGSANL